MNMEQLYKIFLAYPSVETDTRKIKKGDIFFALKGPNFNGNKFASKALEAGAAYCICDEPVTANHENVIYVEDALQTLQALAKHHRLQFYIPIIAITGSNGKTTTKELVHEVLSAKYICYTTKGNLNNHIGIPLTILSIKKDAEIAVIEMGANHQHEIESYCSYCLPTHGLITNCGKAHLEGFGGEEGVKKGKGELYTFLKNNDGIAFVNNDYDYLKEMSRGIQKIITYGTTHAATYCGETAENNTLLTVKITKGATGIIHTKLAGLYNLPNVMSAVCIGKTFGVTDDKIKNALEHYTPDNSRSQIIKKGTNTILLDAYNANPSSMSEAIKNFAEMKADKKIIIIGGMMELGDSSIAEHKNIIDLILKYNWEKVAVAGKDFVHLPPNILHFKDSIETAKWYSKQHFENSTILLKGSRSMAMEKVIEEII